MSAQALPRSSWMTFGPGLARAGERLVVHTQRTRATLNRAAWSLLVAGAKADVEGNWANDGSGWYGTVDLQLDLRSAGASPSQVMQAASTDPHLRLLLTRAAREAASACAGQVLSNVSTEVHLLQSGDRMGVSVDIAARVAVAGRADAR